jgi:hypothetical protein
VAGEWTRRDGSRTVYQPDAAPTIEPAGVPVPLDLAHAWRWEPSVQPLAESGRTERVTLERGKRGEYVLALNDPIAGAPDVISATVTLLEDFRPVSQTFVFDTSEGRREVVLTERDLEAFPPDRVEAARFVPEPELLPSIPTEVSVPTTAPVLSLPPAAPVVGADGLDAIAMQAWYRLHGLGFALGRDALVERRGEGLQVSVTVPSELRRMVVAQRFEGTGDRVRVDIHVAQESTSPAAIAGSNWSSTPTYQRIRGQLASQVSDTVSADIAANETVRWLRAESQRIQTRLEALSRFSSEWPADRLRALDLDSLALWQTVVRDHAVDAGERAESLRQRVETLFGAERQSGGLTPSEPLGGPTDVQRAINRLVARAARQADLIGSALPERDANPNQAPELDLAELQVALAEIEGIAAVFAGPWPLGR